MTEPPQIFLLVNSRDVHTTLRLLLFLQAFKLKMDKKKNCIQTSRTDRWNLFFLFGLIRIKSSHLHEVAHSFPLWKVSAFNQKRTSLINDATCYFQIRAEPPSLFCHFLTSVSNCSVYFLVLLMAFTHQTLLAAPC